MKTTPLLFSITAALSFVTTLRADENSGWQNPDDPARSILAGQLIEGVVPEWPQSAPPLTPAIPPPASQADLITPEIQTLARGLRNDPWLIYQYCYNRIRHECYWGSKKGAALTLLEGSGNCFDTSSLMVALLKAAGVQDVEYRYGQRYLSQYEIRYLLDLLDQYWYDGKPFPELTDWQLRTKFNVPTGTTINDAYRYDLLVSDFLMNRGYPYLHLENSDEFAIPHVWVRFRDAGGTLRELDPTVKEPDIFMELCYRPAGADFGYSSRTAFIGGLGGTLSSDGKQISGLNSTVLNSQLSNCANAFRSWLRADYYHGTATDDFIYKGSPWPLESAATMAGQILTPGTDYSTSTTGIVPLTSWPQIPAQWESTVTFIFGKNYNTTTKDFATSYGTVLLPTNTLGGCKLSLTFSGTTAVFRADETILASFTAPDPTVEMKIAVNHPYGDLDTAGVFHDDGLADQDEVKTYQRTDSSAYAIIYGFDPSAGPLRLSQQRLDNYRKSGLSETAWQVRTEALNVMGLNYLQQVRSADLITGTIAKTLMMDHHIFGRMAQEGAYYIDVGLMMGGHYSFSGCEPDRLVAFQTATHFASALEHGVIEQLQGPSVGAVSTMRIAALANQQGIPLHLADTTNWATTRATLDATNSWPTSVLDKIGTDLAATPGATVLVPSRGDIGLASPPATNQWRGYGYSLISSSNAAMLIGGGYAPGQYSGGYLSSGDTTVSAAEIIAYLQSEPGFVPSASGLNQSAHQAVTTPQWTAADPVDMATGGFTSEVTDLQCGGSLPCGLAFHRSYHSNRSTDDSAGLGFGWTHNLDVRANRRSPARAAWGDTTPAQMAASYVAIAVAMDIFANRATAKDWAITDLIADWTINRIRDGGVAIQMGGPSIEFVQMPDGAFIPPAGITSTLTSGSGGTLDLAERHGNAFHFDASGLLTTVTDPNGNHAGLTYKSITVGTASRTVLDKVTDAYNRTLTFGWENGRITSVTEAADTLSRGTAYAYTNGCLTTVTEPESNTFTYGYDTANRLDSMTDGRGRIISTSQYDSQGRVWQQCLHGLAANTFELFFNGMRNTEHNPNGDETSYLYDSRGRGTDIIDANGNRSSIVYDGQDRKLSTVSPKNNGSTDAGTYHPTIYAYNADHNLLTATLPKRSATDTTANVLTTEYDGQLRPWKTWDLNGHYTETTYTTNHQIYQIKDRKGVLIQTNSYNSDGTLASVTDAANNTTEYLDYDSFGNPKTIKHPSVTVSGASVRPTETFIFNARGDMLEHADRNGHTTSTTYNERRQPRVTTYPTVDGVTSTTEITYDSAGNPFAARDARGNWTYTDTSQTGKLLTATLPPTAAGTSVVTRHYDFRDWNDWTRDPFGRQTSFDHDAVGRVIATTDPLAHTTQNAYNADGELETTTDARNKTTTSRYNWRGELWQTQNALTYSTTIVFDGNGNQDTYTNKRAKLFNFDYDYNDRLTSLKTPLLKQTSRDWNSRGLLDYTQEPSTDRATMLYDNMGRLQTTSYTRGSTTNATLTRELDKQGNLSKLTETITSPATTRILTYSEYDARNRLRTFIDARSQTIGYRYDAAGNLSELIYPGGIGSVHYTYDALNRLETVTDWVNRTTRYHYDIAGRLTSVERPNGTQRRHAYDAVGQLSGISELDSTGQPIYFAVNRHDQAGRQDQEIVSPGPHAYTPISFAATYDDDNRLLTVNSTAAVVDDDGNLTTGPLGTSPSASFTYNTRNQLLTAGGITYTYDPAGNRIGLTDTSGETKWTIDSNATISRALVREKPSGEKTYYIYGLGLIYEITATGTTTTYHYDARGSTVALTAANGQTVLYCIEYDPYGNETWRLGTYDTPFRYNGAYGVQTDPNGLLNMRARYYNPGIRRFLNADPIGFSGGSNWFAYADGNPISLSDPFGLAAGSALYQRDAYGNTLNMTRYRCTGGYGEGGPSTAEARNQMVAITWLGAGVATGAASGLAVAGVAYGALALGADASIVTGGLFATGIAGGTSTAYSIYQDHSADNIAYNVGALAGSAFVGGAVARPLGQKLSPVGWTESIEAPTLRQEFDMRWQDSAGNPSLFSLFQDFGKAMSTGPTFGGAAGSVALTGAGMADFLNARFSNSKK